MSDKDITVTEDGLDQLLDQFDGSLNLRLLLSSYLAQAQAFEDAIHPLLLERSLAAATGDRLDGLGQIAGLGRAGLDDDDYRLAIIAEFAILQSNGTAEEMLTILDLLLQLSPNPVTSFELVEYFPKTLYLRPVDREEFFLEPVNMDAIGTALRRAISAGTELLFVWSYYLDSDTFTLSSQGAVLEFGANNGLADIGATQGGSLSGVS